VVAQAPREDMAREYATGKVSPAVPSAPAAPAKPADDKVKML
jgi:hypothetical protein